ncbi:hypothetical protein ONS95_011468 [Cadophora gregata]|uniref:uncharacterized protein n=1 Tax=Cadophora gregata TaxID=51156 RepID=UPI0026DA94D5|nr:uncharacterized protein ONS95_011468 [Cadophora gregata]KAK0120055.1 hypothetical protein ONS95_011468 [Cadophora gregata]
MTGAAHLTSETGLLAGEFQRFGLMPCEREVCNRGFWESPRWWSAAEATTALNCLFQRCCPIGNRPDEVPGSGFWRRLAPWGITSSKNTGRLFRSWGRLRSVGQNSGHGRRVDRQNPTLLFPAPLSLSRFSAFRQVGQKNSGIQGSPFAVARLVTVHCSWCFKSH